MVGEKTVGCRILTIRCQRHSLKITQSTLSLYWKICQVFVMLQNVLKPVSYTHLVWQMAGYDTHQYTNIRYPFPFDPPYVPQDIPCGAYVHNFEYSRDEKLSLIHIWIINGMPCFFRTEVPSAESRFLCQ